MKIRQILITLLILINFTTLAHAQNDNSPNFITHTTDENENTDKIIFSITNFENLISGDDFKLEIYQNEKLIDDKCIKNVKFEPNTFYKKIICETTKLNTGTYTLVSSITRSNQQLQKSISKYNFQEHSKSSINYQIGETETTITLNVESDLENYQVEHYIPKEIISELTKENQNQLIDSELNYTILDSDPIIAWNIDESPKTIEYKIKKQTNKQDLENLSVKVNENSKTYSYLSYILYLLIIIIIAIILKPMFKKKKTKK